MDGLLHFVQRGGDWAGPHPVKAPLLAVPNETFHPTTASVGLPITALLYDHYGHIKTAQRGIIIVSLAH